MKKGIGAQPDLFQAPVPPITLPAIHGQPWMNYNLSQTRNSCGSSNKTSPPYLVRLLTRGS
jgi:hypothetical protein